MRNLAEIPPSEVRDAVVEMTDKLDISGSVLGEYNLYRAVSIEHEKAMLALSLPKAYSN